MTRTRAHINPFFRVLLALALAASFLLAPPAQAQAINPFTNEVSPDPSIVGEQVTFTLTLTNTAPSTTFTDGIGDNLPDGVEFVSATVVTPDAPQGIPCDYQADDHYVMCGQHRLDPGESITATVIVVPLQPGDFVNQGQSSTGGVVRTPFTVLPAEEQTPQPGSGSFIFVNAFGNIVEISATGITVTTPPPGGGNNPPSGSGSGSLIFVEVLDSGTTVNLGPLNQLGFNWNNNTP